MRLSAYAANLPEGTLSVSLLLESCRTVKVTWPIASAAVYLHFFAMHFALVVTREIGSTGLRLFHESHRQLAQAVCGL